MTRRELDTVSDTTEAVKPIMAERLPHDEDLVINYHIKWNGQGRTRVSEPVFHQREGDCP
jgi:hypothetical protein